jgi:hypothetical protein
VPQNGCYLSIPKFIIFASPENTVQTPKVGRLLVADNLPCERETWFYVVQLIRKQSFS